MIIYFVAKTELPKIIYFLFVFEELSHSLVDSGTHLKDENVIKKSSDTMMQQIAIKQTKYKHISY